VEPGGIEPPSKQGIEEFSTCLSFFIFREKAGKKQPEPKPYLLKFR